MLFIDTADVDEIKMAKKIGLFKGVTTNPTILLREKKNRFQALNDILDTEIGLVLIQLLGDTVEQRMEDFKTILSKLEGRNIGIKVPIDMAGLETVRQIRSTHPEMPILGTVIYSAEQGILAGMAGCNYVAPYVNRMLDNNIDPFEQIHQMYQIFKMQQLPCKVMAASFKNAHQVLKAMESGALTATIAYDVFEKMVNKNLTISALQVFNTHGKELDLRCL